MGSNQELGAWGEDVAAAHLLRAGMAIVARNWRCARGDVRGEIDVVALDRRTLVFCEVKVRRRLRSGEPLAAVTHAKQAQLRRLAATYLAARRHTGDVRFDAIGILGDPGGVVQLVHVRGAW